MTLQIKQKAELLFYITIVRKMLAAGPGSDADRSRGLGRAGNVWFFWRATKPKNKNDLDVKFKVLLKILVGS